LSYKCDFRGKNISNIKTFLEVNIEFCIKSGTKSFSVYKQKAINEITKDKVYLVKLPKKLLDKNQGESIENINDKDNKLISNEDSYWYFLACYTNLAYLRNYVFYKYSIKDLISNFREE